MENDYTKGIDNYLISVDEAVALFNAYQQKGFGEWKPKVEYNTGMAFVQKETEGGTNSKNKQTKKGLHITNANSQVTLLETA